MPSSQHHKYAPSRLSQKIIGLAFSLSECPHDTGVEATTENSACNNRLWKERFEKRKERIGGWRWVWPVVNVEMCLLWLGFIVRYNTLSTSKSRLQEEHRRVVPGVHSSVKNRLLYPLFPTLTSTPEPSTLSSAIKLLLHISSFMLLRGICRCKDSTFHSIYITRIHRLLPPATSITNCMCLALLHSIIDISSANTLGLYIWSKTHRFINFKWWGIQHRESS